MRLPIKAKFATALGLLAVAVLAAGFCSVAATRFNEDALSDLQQGRLRSLLLARDAQSAFHRYVKEVDAATAAKDPQGLATADTVVTELGHDLSELTALDGPADLGVSDRLAAFVRVSKEVVRLSRGEAGASADLEKRVLEATELRRRLGNELQEFERNASLSYERDIAGIIAFNRSATKVYMLFVSLMTIAAIGLSGTILATVLRRIRRLSEHFANTDLEKITPLAGTDRHQDELDDLVLAANRMLLGIKESRRQLVDKALLDIVMDALVDLIVVVDGKGRIVRANRASERLLASIPSQLEGCPFSDWLVLDERSRLGNVRDVLTRVAAGEAVSEDLSLQSASAALIQVQLIGAPLPGSAAGHAVFVARDVRLQLATERKMQGIQAQLVQASKLASLGTLGAGVAHELNNPLAAVRGYAELIANAADTPAGTKVLATKILGASDRIRKITDHLRIFAADTSRNEKAAVSLNAIVQDSLILLQNQLVTAGLTVQVALAPDLPPVTADANQLENVVQNLLTNARDALLEAPGGRSRELCIRTSLDASGRVCIHVEDNAEGIPELVQPRVFDPFFTTKDIGKGTGLGLSIAHGIVRDHGGSLSFTTKLGQGTVFTAAFPPAAVHGGRVEAAPASAPVLTGKRTLVIIDDEPEICDLLSMQLSADFTVETYSNPSEALQRCTDRSFDLVITDMRMPEMSGLDLLRRLKKIKPDARLMVISGSSVHNADVVQALAEGAIGVIAKPFPAKMELRRLLGEALLVPMPEATLVAA